MARENPQILQRAPIVQALRHIPTQCVIILAAIGLGVVLGMAPDRVQDDRGVVIAKEFQVRDDNGTVRIQLGLVQGEPQLRLYSADGGMSAFVGVHNGIPSIYLTHDTRISISAAQTKADVSLFSNVNRDNVPSVSMNTADDSASVFVRGTTHGQSQSAELAWSSLIGVALSMRSNVLHPEVLIGANPGGSMITLYDKNKNIIFHEGLDSKDAK